MEKKNTLKIKLKQSEKFFTGVMLFYEAHHFSQDYNPDKKFYKTNSWNEFFNLSCNPTNFYPRSS